MSGISAVGSVSSAYSAYGSYGTVASGGALTTAAQDAAGLAIDQRTEAQTRGLDQGTENLKDGKSALNIEDGALDQVTDYLQNIRELALRASNGTLGDEEKGYIQGQIDQYLQGIDDIAKKTTFNEKKLLDGSENNINIAAGGSSNLDISTGNSTVEKLGLNGFNVTGENIDLKAVDDALKSVQSLRTDVGADTNRVDYATAYNTRASLELNGFRMDGDEERSMKALQDIKAKQVLDQYQMMLQKKQQEDEAQKSQIFSA